MPRISAKSKAKCGKANIKSCNAPKKEAATKTLKNDKKGKGYKKGIIADTSKGDVNEEVFHRKSERRRVARDIFLVFEEETNSRRRTRGSNKKQIKPKFGHLKVEDPLKSKGLLRDIKNEPRCYLNGNNTNTNATAPSSGIVSKSINVLNKQEKIKKPVCKNVNFACSNKSNIKSIKISAVESEPHLKDNEARIVARVNPIFLWAKQDDTRIVEVRCEDYDKRNRIRITKTSNGWRAIPRSDPTSSRVLKFNPTPLMKVKRENLPHEINNKIININIESKEAQMCKSFGTVNIFSENKANEIDTKLNEIDTIYNPLANKNAKLKTKNKKSKKVKKSHSEKSSKKSKTNTAIENVITNFESIMKPSNQTFNKNSLEEQQIVANTNENFECKKYENIFGNRLSTNNFVEKIQPQAYQNNVQTLVKKSNEINSTSTIGETSETKSTYQKECEEELAFQLCPETGLFLPKQVSEYEIVSLENEHIQNFSKITPNGFINSNKEEVNTNVDTNNTESKIQITEEKTESLEDKTKNLKDLLDDADLLQHCDDNANSDAELIDSLVKTSCENNLIQANEIITKANMDQLHQKTLHDNDPNEMVVQLISDVNNPPKCLSFNEAGEIEGLNEELFQSNTYIDTFDKQSSSLITESQMTLHSTSSLSPQRNCENIESVTEVMDVNSSKVCSVNIVEESAKDLSYKKREEVCPPSESRSQCAVTSSSDVIKSPQREDTSLASSSETLKNLILEQFMRLNVLTNQHQIDAVDPGKQRDLSNIKSLLNCKSGQSNDIIETVVIEDDDDNSSNSKFEQEPLKKRLRLNKTKVVTQNVNKITLIDKDPDPLTQLRLLIRNTQWKVPDPILVPKDRLSAVLASPAREIPLLITTRPELRLPEAFAYPEIIQNPNILVISMAQLEAILKNEVQVESASSSKVKEPVANQQFTQEEISAQENDGVNSLTFNQRFQNSMKKPRNLLSSATTSQVSNNINKDSSNISTDSLYELRQDKGKCCRTEATLSSDLNSATLAMLNQMLWLPYFGQISEGIVKSLKNPIALQEKCSNMTPILNSNLEDIYKINRKISEQSVSNSGFQNFQRTETNTDLSLFQKIVQQQMQNVLHFNQLKADSSQISAPLEAVNTASPIEKTNSNIESLSNFIKQRKQKVILPNNKQTNSFSCKSQINDCNNSTSITEKSYNLRSSVAGRHSSESKQYSNNNQKQNSDNKPRLTCKSLSNLLDPEHSMVPSNSSNPYLQNLSSEFSKNANEIKKIATEFKVSDRNAEFNGTTLVDPNILPPLTGSCGISNISIGSTIELTKQKPKTFVDSVSSDNTSGNNDIPGLTTDTNIPLWHPLFGSNTKTAYSSPWQWTTVTATGE